MNRHLNFVTLICLITGFVSLASCSNDDDEMDKYQKIYIRTGVAYNCVPYSRLRGMSLPLWE